MSYSPPSTAKPYTLNISDSALSSWRQLLELSPLGPKTFENTQEKENYGVTYKWLSDAKEYWLNTYSWRDEEKRINSFPNYTMQIDGIDVHFIALFSEKKDAVPIIFSHGWPGSFLEFLPMCDLVRKKYEAKDLPYHIIVPSVPGYTLSAKTSVDKDWTLQDSARILNQLMTNLGFSKYIAQGGDVGCFLTTIMALTYDSCVAAHLNMLAIGDAPVDEDKLSALEKTAVQHAKVWAQSGRAYAMEHGTRPSTIGHVLSSSPLALLAWIGEKFLEWSDESPSLDTILTNVSLYWFTQGFPTSLYPYRQLFSPDRKPFPYIAKPTGYSMFPHELYAGLRSNAEKVGNLVFYKQHEHGGHFAALEKPEELWGDVSEFVGKVWNGGEGEAKL